MAEVIDDVIICIRSKEYGMAVKSLIRICACLTVISNTACVSK
jgi:hypothetical protein